MKGAVARYGLLVLLACAVTLCFSMPAFSAPPFQWGITGDQVKVGVTGDDYLWSPGAKNVAGRLGSVFGVYHDMDRSGVIFAMSEDGGTMWGKELKLSSSYGWPAIAASAYPSDPTNRTNIHVVWQTQNGSVYYTGCTTGGATLCDQGGWSTPALINSTSYAETVVAADDSGNIYATFESVPGLMVAKSSDGSDWSQQRIVTTDNVRSPVVGVDGSGNVHVTWYGESDTNVYYSRSTDQGQSWSSAYMINDPTYYGDYPSLGTYGNVVCIGWWGGDSPYYIESRCSQNNGVTWDTIVESAQGIAFRPSVAVGPSGVVYILWTVNNNPNYDIYLLRSTDGGKRFDSPVQVGETWEGPSVASDENGNALMFWVGKPPRDTISFTTGK